MSAISGSPVASVRRSAADVLVLCTANVCRSPMAAALLASRLTVAAPGVRLHSAGQLVTGAPALPEAVRAMARYRIDISAHRSREVTAADLAGADVILAMARENLRHAVVLDPAAWPRSFTLKELVRRGEAAGPRHAGEPLPAWLARVHLGRQRTALLGDSADDDVFDPSGGPQDGYDRAAVTLSRLVDQLASCCWPVSDAS